MAGATIDPITLQVINGALQTIAEEMGHVLYRMSFSSIIRESQDLGAGLFDTEFNTLCESESTPLHIGSLPGYLAGIRDTLQDGEWHEGDLVIHNHPYHGSSHSPDIAVVVPVFYEGALVGYSANTAHHLDIGAATPGLIIDIPDVFAEGMLFAGTKLYERGKRNEAVWEFIRRNSRAARQLQDDLDAQIASARLGAKRFVELMDRYGRQMVLDATQQLMDYTERVLRQRIAAIPDGEYRAEGFLDDDGKNRDVRLPIKVCVRVQGDGIEIDLTGSSKQVETAFNVPFEGSTKVACFCAIRSLLLDAVTSDVKVPSNQGSFRPVKVTAPKGSIYNPIYPAAAEARFAQINRVIDLIYKALAPVLPNDIIAGSSASLSFCSYAGIRPTGDYWVFLEVNEGSYGGRPRADGPDSIDNLMANTRNNPIEDLAMHLPMICDRYELRDDVMPGAGRFRGGIGVVKAQRVLTDAFITHENERHHDVPWGIFGGDSGQVGKVDIYNVAHPTDIKHMPAKFSGLRVAAGDVHVFYGPCGGGYGEPLERPAEKFSTTFSTTSALSSMPDWPMALSSIRSPRRSMRPAPRRFASACGGRHARGPPHPPNRRGKHRKRRDFRRPGAVPSLQALKRSTPLPLQHWHRSRPPPTGARSATRCTGCATPMATRGALRSSGTALTAARSKSSANCAPTARPCAKPRSFRAFRANRAASCCNRRPTIAFANALKR